MIKPVNGHLIIEPIIHEGFIASQNDTFQEIGIVIDFDQELFPLVIPPYYKGEPVYSSGSLERRILEKGDKVYFDSWLAKKYPKADGKNGEFYWLVKWEDVAAIEYVESKISK